MVRLDPVTLITTGDHVAPALVFSAEHEALVAPVQL
jgi:hypothetical protein